MRLCRSGFAPASPGGDPPRLALRFAVLTAIGLALAGAFILVFVRHFSTKQAERAATTQARYLADATLADGLRASDFGRQPTAARRRELDRLFADDVLLGDVVGATLLDAAGRVTYSSDPGLIGSRSTSPARVAEAVSGQIVTDVAFTADEGFSRQSLKALRAFVPVNFTRTGRVGVVAVYLDYAPIARAAHEAFLPIAGVLEVVLLLLYMTLVPLLRRATARLRTQMLEIEHRALHDELTGLPNRTLFQDRIQLAIATARRDGTGAAVMLIDLDRFKEINDTLGHHAGDLLLRDLGDRLRGLLREGETIARLGGDEFGVSLAGVDRMGAENVAQRVLEAFQAPFGIRDLSLAVDASVGIAMFPEHGADAATLVQCADVAMYQAKATRTSCAFYSSEDDPNDARRLSLVGQLRRALDESELQLHFQPQIALATDEVVGAEALVRWLHPELGLVLPGEFVPLAERTGLVKPLSRFVLDAALGQCSDWARQGVRLPVAVNVAVPTLIDPDLPDEIASLLEKWGVEPELLELEITEGSIMADPFRVKQVLDELTGMGVRLAIDDFGTGYSSLAYLKRLPLHVVKIDKSFVLNMLESRNDAMIVGSTVELGQNLGLQVVAEGVENERIWRALEDIGCDVAQGYYVGRPISAAELTSRMLALKALRDETVRSAPVPLPSLRVERVG